MRIVRAENKDLPEIVGLSIQLWPENDRAEMEREFQELLQRDDVAVFLTLDEETTFEDAMTGAYGSFSAMQEAFDQ